MRRISSSDAIPGSLGLPLLGLLLKEASHALGSRRPLLGLPIGRPLGHRYQELIGIVAHLIVMGVIVGDAKAHGVGVIWGHKAESHLGARMALQHLIAPDR